ncbi:MAG: helix-turn-helix transcriptional regulator [Anaerolineales bacterium]|nr:helix-turn-helix transcriptional regulator [Anaerolineales bacterium]
MSEDQALQLRAKILGVLLRGARLSSGKSMKDLGAVIGVSASTLGAIERGESAPSLPELELLAYVLDVPVAHFWSEQLAYTGTLPGPGPEARPLLALRHRSIGAQLRQARSDRGLSQKDLAERTGISASRIRRYENGETPVPLPELEQLAGVLQTPIEAFTDKAGPIGEWRAAQNARQALEEMPAELQEFVADPQNRPYLDLARRLQAVSLERLAELKDGLSALLDPEDQP